MSQQRRNPFGPHGQLGGITPSRMSPAPVRASPASGYPVGYGGYQSPGVGLWRGASPSPSESSSSGSGINLTIRELAGKKFAIFFVILYSGLKKYATFMTQCAKTNFPPLLCSCYVYWYEFSIWNRIPGHWGTEILKRVLKFSTHRKNLVSSSYNFNAHGEQHDIFLTNSEVSMSMCLTTKFGEITE